MAAAAAHVPAGQPRVLADSGNRVLAFILDLVLLGFLLGGAFGVAEGTIPEELAARIIPATVFLVYCTAMPLTPLQGTVGKWICRLKLCDRRGERLEWRRAFVRAAATLGWLWLAGSFLGASDSSLEGTALMVAWSCWWLAWGATIWTPWRQSAFDLVAGTLVVRLRAEPAAIAAADPGPRIRYANLALAVLVCGVAGFLLGSMQDMARMRNLFSRVHYAVQAVQPLRDRIAAFHARENRWPTASELGVAEWTPYPDGGGYRLQPDASILIGFSVLPQLKGHTILLRPVAEPSGAISWKCTPDPGFRSTYLPALCRA